MHQDLISFKAKICITASAWLVHEQKVLLVHHKKLDIWLAPGGHVDENELPHQAAEREMWEETGLKVKALHNTPLRCNDSLIVPNPIYSDLHWVCQENYQVRTKGADPEIVPVGWREKGCEQHICFAYLVEATGSLDFRQNVEETLGIGWFGIDDLPDLKTTEGIRNEARYVLGITKSLL